MSLDQALRDKVCVVTGGASGIGLAAAQALAARGAKVMLADVNRDAGEQAAAGIVAAGGEAAFLPCDVLDKAQIGALMEGTVERFGAIDALINNAGVQESQFTDQLTIDTLPDDVWEKVFAINVRGTWWCIKAAVPHLRRSTRVPTILNAASRSSFVAFPGNPVYAATKGAVLQLTKTAALDLAPQVRCNCYVPGTTDTGMISAFLDAAPSREEAERGLSATNLIPRIGRPEDVAKVICFLASDDAEFVTGAAYAVDGGSMAWRGSRL